jgi:hypothetical protein
MVTKGHAQGQKNVNQQQIQGNTGRQQLVHPCLITFLRVCQGEELLQSKKAMLCKYSHLSMIKVIV